MWCKLQHCLNVWDNETDLKMWRSFQSWWLHTWKPESSRLQEHLSPNPLPCLERAPSVLSQVHTPVEEGKKRLPIMSRKIFKKNNEKTEQKTWSPFLACDLYNPTMDPNETCTIDDVFKSNSLFKKSKQIWGTRKGDEAFSDQRKFMLLGICKEKPTWENWKRCPACGRDFSVLSLAKRDKLGDFSRTVSGGSMVTESWCKHKKRKTDTQHKDFKELL